LVDINTKSHGDCCRLRLFGLTVTPVGKRVFLLVVSTIPNAMLCMTTTVGMVQKAAGGRSKSPPLAVKKQLIVSPSLTLPKGREFVLAVF